MRVLLVLLSLGLAAAGCASPETAPAGTTPGVADAPATRDESPPPAGTPREREWPAPEWAPGEWWRWRIEAQDAPAFEVTTIVARVEGDAYVVGVDALDEGLRGLAFHVLAAGRIARGDLAWEAHDLPTRVLAFPLADGAAWTGEMEGRELSLRATAARAASPAGEVDAFDVVGMAGDAPGVTFSYAPAVGHFLRFSVHYGGDAYATATLVGHGDGAARAIVLETDDAFIAFAGTPVPPRAPPPAPWTFDVPEGATHVYLACSMGGAGHQRATVAPPGGPPVACERADASDGSAFAFVLAPATPGAWGAALVAAGGHVEVEAYVVRTQEATPGQAGTGDARRAGGDDALRGTPLLRVR